MTASEEASERLHRVGRDLRFLKWALRLAIVLFVAATVGIFVNFDRIESERQRSALREQTLERALDSSRKQVHNAQLADCRRGNALRAVNQVSVAAIDRLLAEAVSDDRTAGQDAAADRMLALRVRIAAVRAVNRPVDCGAVIP